MLNAKHKKKIYLFFFSFFILPISFLFLVSAIEFSESILNDIEKKYGDYAKKRVVSWEKLMKENQNISEAEKLEKVNKFFNLLEYLSDKAHWNVEDYWATPLEFLVSGAGDCEDFSIAKYFTLRELGVDDEKLLITYVKYTEYGGYEQAHMVLTYYETPTSIPLVLDNIRKEILSADKRADLRPIYSFNGSGLWRSKELSKGKKLGTADDVNMWADMQERMKSGKIGKFNRL